MKLSELFAFLTYGELADIRSGGKDEGGIYPLYSDEVNSYITQGLTDLYTRFPISQKELILQLHEEVSHYNLHSDHAYSNEDSDEYYKYIDDLGQYPFKDDLLKVTKVYNELGQEMLMNADEEFCMIYTPQPKVLQVVNPEDTNTLSILYKAAHPSIALVDGLTPDDIELEIPVSFVQPLCLFVSYLAHSSIGSPESNAFAMGKYQQYQAACLLLDMTGILNKDTFVRPNLKRDGWV